MSQRVIIPEVMQGHARPCPHPCPYMAGDCSRCPQMNLGQVDASESLNVSVDAGNLTEQINACLAAPSPLFGLPWGLVLIGGFGLWALTHSKGGR